MGMQDVIQNVVTQYNLQDNASSGLAAIAGRAEFLSSAMQGIGSAISIVSNAINTVRAPIMQAVQAQSQMEETVLGVAGALRAYEAVGQTSAQIAGSVRRGANEAQLLADNFHVAQDTAQGLFRQMVREAAVLPGSARDYVTAFSTALPAALASARTASLTEITRMSNLFTATALVNQIDAGQAGRDLMLMLQGSAGMDVRTWRLLQPLMHRTATTTARLQATEFNRMTGEQRYQAITRALQSYQPLINQFADTWSTQVGTFESLMDQLKLDASGSIFQVAKNVLARLNVELAEILPKIGKLGEAFSRLAIYYLDPIINSIQGIGTALTRAFTSAVNSPAFRTFSRIIQSGLDFYQNLTTMNVRGETSEQSRVAQNQRFGVLAIFTGPMMAGFIRFLTEGTNAARFMQLLGFITARVYSIFMSIINRLGESTGVFANMFESVMPTVERGILWFLRVIDEMIGPAFQFAGIMIGMFAWAVQPLVSAFTFLFGQLMQGTTTITMIISIISGFIILITAPFALLARILAEIVSGFVSLLGAIAWAINKIYELLGSDTRVALTNPLNRGSNETPPWLQRIRDYMSQVEREGASRRRNPNRTPAQSAGTHNDFRYSRFDITQRFAEGFDPDRVAAVFASDLEGLAEQRLDSGFSPAFGTS